jgi:hypothetical protein
MIACAAGGESSDSSSGGQGGTGAAAGSAGAAGVAGAVEECGNGSCAGAEDCLSCAADCGQCATCPAPACQGAELPPANPAPKFEWNVKLQRLDSAQIRRRIRELLERDPGVYAVLDALLGAPSPAGAPAWLTDLSASMRRHVELTKNVRALLPAGVHVSAGRETWADLTPGELCGKPMLRARLSRLDVVEEVDDIRNDAVYCIIRAEAASGDEVRVTPVTPKLDSGTSYSYTVKEGVFWGTDGLKDPESNLVITYDCIEQDQGTAYAELIQELGNALQKVGEQEENVWLSQAGTAATIINMALAQNSDDHVFNAQQTLEAQEFYSAASGVTWNIEKDGEFHLSSWKWRLKVEMWGCAELGTPPQ